MARDLCLILDFGSQFKQLACKLLGGEVVPAAHREYGRAHVTVADMHGRPAELFHGFTPGEELAVWMSHGDRVERLPDGFTLIGETRNAPAAAVVDEKRG